MNILRKLTLHNLKLNKTRTLVTIIGIMLSTALITAVAGVASSGQMSLFNMAVHHNGDYDLNLTGKFDDKTAEKLQNNRDVESVYKYRVIGTAEFESKSKYRPYIRIVGISENAFENCYKCELESGRFPANPDELLLSSDFVKNSVNKYKVGDTIKLEIGERWQKGKIDPDNIPTSSEEKAMYYHIEYDNDIQIDEELIGEFEKNYKVVGILSDDGALTGKSYGGAIDVFTAADFSKNAQHSKYYNYNELYINFTDSAERDYIRVTSEITGVDEKYVNGLMIGFFSQDKDEEEAYRQLENANFGIKMFNINKEVLHYKGLALSETNSEILFGIASFVIVIILISSIFIIRNSFAISITEKTKLYGMLSSTGATPRQIRHNVIFEAFILGLIGIPLGIGLGVGVTALLILMCNTLLAEGLNGFSIVFAVEPYAVIASALLGILTIFFSTIIIALKASKISPIEAIRSSNDIKVKQKPKNYKTPKLISKLFGIGGSIAWKNLKRSKKKYRTTVISIVVSVTVFIAVFSLVQSMVSYSRLYYQEVDYNLIVSENIKPEIAERAREFSEVEEAIYRNEVFSYCISVPVSRLAPGIEDKNIGYWSGKRDFKDWLSEDGKSANLMLSFTTLDQISYRELIKILGYDYDDIKDKGIIANYTYLFDKAGYSTKQITRLFSSTEGLRLEGYNDEGSEHSAVPIEIGGEFESPEKLGKFTQIIGSESLIVSPEWFEKNIDNENVIFNNNVFINSSDADKTEQALTKMYDGLYIFNNEKQARMMNALVLVIQIFVYGFILVISLIGLTNIFNTITTNMRLRSKEFAMLRSVGMTNKEFNRMVRLESIFYTAKSLVFGILLGIIGGYIAYRVFERNNVEITYSFPWLAIVIAIVAVMLVVWMIMRFSISKVRKQNIIETIRNDNI